MNRYEKSRFPFEPLLSELQQVFGSSPDVLSAYLFGSAAEGLLREKSDIDIAVRMRQTLSPIETSNIREKLEDVLEAVFQRKVDVTVMNRASLKMIHQVYKHGVQIYVKASLEERDFRIQKRKEYFDFQYYMERERRDLRLFYGC